MRGLIDGILFGLAILFLIRLYTSNDWFYGQVNQLFTRIQFAHQWFIQQSKRSKKWKVSILFLIVIFGILSLAIFSEDIYYGILFLLLVFVPAIYIYGEQVKSIQADPVDQMIDRINEGLVSKKDLDRLRATIKQFYSLIYAPKERDDSPPTLLFQLVKGVIILVYPKLWKMYLIPFITRYSLFSSFFYSSPFHARFSEYQPIIDSIHESIGPHPYRLKSKEIRIDEQSMVIVFKNTNNHDLSRLTSLARKIEKDHQLTSEAIIVQENNDEVKLFIPAAALKADE